MGIIRKLDEQLSNMIAAGEVVERPSAVVKELIENALDAKAHRIVVKINEGGIALIDIQDDGIGMDYEDATQAFERHATSKIHSKEELFAPMQLGFRGEALPSIASVSKTTLITSQNQLGTKVLVNYGQLDQVHELSATKGTRIIVEGLFRKTPARLKHLKSASYEASLILNLVEKFALSHPDVAFSVQDEHKVLLNTQGNGSLMDVYGAIYGGQLYQSVHPFIVDDFDFKVEGVWVEPQENRANQKEILIFINGRMIRSFHLSKAVTEAYASYLPAHRYPMALLHIHMDSKLVDVNVHPSKWEVRLSKEQQLYYLIVDGLGKVLHHAIQAKPSELIKTLEVSEQAALFNVNQYPLQDAYPLKTDQPSIEPLTLELSHPTFPVLDLIGQMHGRYILASTQDELYWIDQHAAKERINYELILNQLKDSSEHFDLLIPLRIETKMSFMERFEDFAQKVSPLGLRLEAFSLNAYVVRTIPIWMRNWELKTLCEDLMDRYENSSKLDQASLREALIATMACHRSVRFNQALTKEDMQQILKELAHCDQPYQCPHGRPTLVKIQGQLLWKDFNR